jgi:hypothetical protein
LSNAACSEDIGIYEKSTSADALIPTSGNDGGVEEDRTPDLRIANATLSQLSYHPVKSASFYRYEAMATNSVLVAGAHAA